MPTNVPITYKEPQGRPIPFYIGYIAGWRNQSTQSCRYPVGTPEANDWAKGWSTAWEDLRAGRSSPPTSSGRPY